MIQKIWRTVRGKSEKDAFYGFLVQLLGRKPRKKDLYLLAFRHKSASLYVAGRKLNNERLEYLGDAVLGTIIADIVFRRYPNQREGFLTKLRSKMVNRKQLNKLGTALEFEKHLLFNGTVAENVLGNCVEAFVGAMYLDFGYDETKRIIEKQIVKKYVNFEVLLRKDENFKSKLVEWAQHRKKEIVFVTDESEKHGRPYFYSKVLIAGEALGKGEGTSKKKSQQIAARTALRDIYSHKE